MGGSINSSIQEASMIASPSTAAKLLHILSMLPAGTLVDDLATMAPDIGNIWTPTFVFLSRHATSEYFFFHRFLVLKPSTHYFSRRKVRGMSAQISIKDDLTANEFARFAQKTLPSHCCPRWDMDCPPSHRPNCS